VTATPLRDQILWHLDTAEEWLTAADLQARIGEFPIVSVKSALTKLHREGRVERKSVNAAVAVWGRKAGAP
jgi:hypothetical protein